MHLAPGKVNSVLVAIAMAAVTFLCVIPANAQTNRSPVAHIDSISLSPATEGKVVLFRGHGTDPDRFDRAVSYHWMSTIDGELSTSSMFATKNLSVGEHTIYLRVKDLHGAWSEQVSQTLVVNQRPQNQLPVAHIDSISLSPATEGKVVLFRGHGTDPDRFDRAVSYHWTSTIDGELSTSSMFATKNLSVGEHTIYLKVKDKHGAWSEQVSQTLVVEELDPPPGMSVDNDNVPKLTRMRAHNTMEVSFFVIADPHFTSDYKFDLDHLCWGFKDDKLPNLRAVASNINGRCKRFQNYFGNEQECIGGVMAGDMTRLSSGSGHWDDSVYTFRALYEHDNPNGVHEDCCDGCAYCKTPGGYAQIKYPMFLGVGNHDDHSEYTKDPDVVNYVRDRVAGSTALYHRNLEDAPNSHDNYYGGYGSDMYAWEWGSFHFIWLGLWAFYDQYEGGSNASRDSVNTRKIDWLKAQLASVGKDKPIVLFQHFGWDYLSLGEKNDAGGPLWWSADNIDLFADAICDREVKVGDSGSCDEPYNVIGIFSGHLHDFSYHENVCARGVYDLKNYRWETCYENLFFNNYVVNDAGHDWMVDGTDAGYYLVHLSLMEGSSDDNGMLSGKMTVNRVGIEYTSGSYNMGNDCAAYRINDEYYNTKRGWPKTYEFNRSQFIRFDQGEPNNVDGKEHCAEIKSNGRWNDNSCEKMNKIICKDNNDGWHISAKEYTWREGFGVCENSGWTFPWPGSIKEQRDLIKLLHDDGAKTAWINATDLLFRGRWEKGPEYLRYFDKGEPNNGEQNFEKGWGQNCAAVLKNSTVHDMNCEMNLNKYLCRNSSGYYVKKKTGPWIEGYDICDSPDDYARDPMDWGDAIEAAKQYWAANSDDDSPIWVGTSDISSEGSWDMGPPWLWRPLDPSPYYSYSGWKIGEPNNGNGITQEDCALMRSDGFWNDVPCENYHENAFACRNYVTGEWKKSKMKSTNWINGFQACRDLGLRFHFATPIRQDDNWVLKDIAGGEAVWINYTDADSDNGEDMEGHWRHGFWKHWGSGQPDNYDGDENCVVTAGNQVSSWGDKQCWAEHPVLCRLDAPNNPHAGDWTILVWDYVKWSDAENQCRKADLKFTYPTCPSEQEKVDSLIYTNTVWIKYNDINREGTFQPWH